MRRSVFRNQAFVYGALFVALLGVVGAAAQPASGVPEASATVSPASQPPEASATIAPTIAEEAGTAATKTGQIVPPVPRLPKFDLNEAASRYVALVMEADQIATQSPLTPDGINRSLRITARMSSKGITEGAGAFVALTAASHSEFASSLATVVNILGRDAVLARLKENPAQLFGMINGYGSALKLASGALSTSTESLSRAETVLGAAAYSVQKESWAQRVVDTPATLAALRAEAVAATGLDELTAWTMPARISDDPVNERYMLAASYILLGDQISASELLDKPLGRMCMNRVQLNIRQCVAASQYPYEHLFCLSRHSFGEASVCVKNAAK